MNKKRMNCMLLLILLVITARSQNPVDSLQIRQTEMMMNAYNYLKARGKPYKPEKAFNLYKECAEAGNVDAMTALGTLYQQGRGVARNHEQAKYWYTKAAEAGNAAAWSYVGRLHKDGLGCEQDFERSYYFYTKAAAAGAIEGIHDQAYMLYKGLGVQQSYRQAFPLFKESAEKGDCNSMYFLGLFYRNGYGVVANSDSALYWLNKALELGERQAAYELEKVQPENPDVQEGSCSDEPVVRPGKKYSNKPWQPVEHRMDLSLLPGTYAGSIIRYDFSGQHVLEQSPFRLQLEEGKGRLSGWWLESDSLSIPLEAELTSTAVVFNNAAFRRGDHYSPSRAHWQLQDASLFPLQLGDSVFLTGNVRLYSMDRKEPSAPIYIALTRAIEKNAADTASSRSTQETGTDEDTESSGICGLTAYPNPFHAAINVEFELEKAARVHVSIVSIGGTVVTAKNCGRLEKGKHSLQLSTGTLPGNYVLRVQAGAKVITIGLLKL